MCPITVRVPAVYLAHAFLAILAVDAERGMNNLRVCKGLDSSIPTTLNDLYIMT